MRSAHLLSRSSPTRWTRTRVLRRGWLEPEAVVHQLDGAVDDERATWWSFGQEVAATELLRSRGHRRPARGGAGGGAASGFVAQSYAGLAWTRARAAP